MADESRPSKKARGSADSGLTTFALRLSNKFAEGGDEDKNVAFSPLSLFTSLGLVAAGARGKTIDELLALLGAASRDDIAELVRGLAEGPLDDMSGSGGPFVTFAYGVWYQRGMKVKPDYFKTAVESYKAVIQDVDFSDSEDKRKEIIKEINNWAAEATNKLIPSILPEGSLYQHSRFVLANAIYFKGQWETSFDKSDTDDGEFYLLDGGVIDVPFMSPGGECKAFMKRGDGFKVLKLPYKAGDPTVAKYSMCIFLPDKNNDLKSMVDKLAAKPGSLFNHIPTEKVTMRVLRLPKFKLSFFCRLKEVLESLGVEEAFGKKADVSDMVGQDDCDLCLDEVFHKAFVEVDEEGTKAAACTAISGRVKQCARRTEEFVADHPFVFFIMEELSRAVIFVGHVLDPSSTSDS